MRVLVSGGAGFIGSHRADDLLRRGDEVRIVDCLDPQVHAQGPRFLPSGAEFIQGDVTDPSLVRQAIKGIDAVVHLAAAVGVGQSMYQAEHYVRTNTLATATLLTALSELADSPVRRLVVASSMSIYGEGSYACPSCGT